jgi:ATP-dependent exoDNAse (exonuclease V) alpha subunit
MKQEQALQILKSGANVFLTGEPGSGKTYTINKYVAYLHSHGIKPAVTASTGIAATHIGGTTIHSWSGIGIKDKLSKSELAKIVANDYVRKRIEAASVLIIDEISMLPPQTLQMVDTICKAIKQNTLAFGGLQVVAVGDFFQLPPINKNFQNHNAQENLFEEKISRFAYDSPVWQEAEFMTCYITEQYRQDDQTLISVLAKIRHNRFDAEALSHIQKRKLETLKIPADAPKLFSHNIDVDRVNTQMLAKIKSPAHLFSMDSSGPEALVKAMKKGCLSPEKLYLKIGAAVMFTKNNNKDGFVNGTLGIVEDFSHDGGLPIVKTRDGRKIKVNYADWLIEEDGKPKGTLTQLPLRLAWALTVHKSQGISLDEAVIDLSRVFEFGQGYVALSRVRRLNGIYLLGWNKIAFQVDPQVLEKDQELREHSAKNTKDYDGFSDKDLKNLAEDFILSCAGMIQVESGGKHHNQHKHTNHH